MDRKLVIGVDFGSDSVRSVLVDSENGETLATSVKYYQRWVKGLYCDPGKNQFRQHPLDHIEGIEKTITSIVEESGEEPSSIKGICIDTTGSSPVPVDKDGVALSLKPEFTENPNAMMVLWKDHTAINEAEEINKLARSWGGEDFTKFEGGIYSSEWFWAKVLHISREDEAVKKAAYSWIEHCDYMTYLLAGDNNLDSFKRSRCAAGHKAMWHPSWNGLPADEFLSQLDPHLVTLKKNLYSDTYTSDEVAGNLNEEWADRLGLSTDVVVSVGTFDAHAGAVGAEVEEFTLVRIMGTSTCDIIVSPNENIGNRTVKGICGQVDGSVIPNMMGLEAGQSAFGDVLAWFKNVISWPLDQLTNSHLSREQKEQIKDDIIAKLSEQAAEIPHEESNVLALDWVNGRRTPDADQKLKAAIMNLNMGSGAPQIFKALVEAICFGSKAIVDRFEEEGVQIKTIVGIGGVAKKSDFIMQTLANVLNMPIKVAVSEQAPALGAAMYAAVSAKIYPDLTTAMKAMSSGVEKEYLPNPEEVAHYESLYAKYLSLGGYVESVTKEN